MLIWEKKRESTTDAEKSHLNTDVSVGMEEQVKEGENCGENGKLSDKSLDTFDKKIERGEKNGDADKTDDFIDSSSKEGENETAIEDESTKVAVTSKDSHDNEVGDVKIDTKHEDERQPSLETVNEKADDLVQAKRETRKRKSIGGDDDDDTEPPPEKKKA
ncbi:topoisomerase 1-associated factor 1-like [Xenia sp. Carnegie-2017]|uniref:topoisomerase 1-associated factor 1-like n=1 Tax=Xenia sp. Carnegie-2017 TaxID=2897299 RepID=UPI001F034452|nr:topoisomerase 1-associated factor 1-like [Xenia sp. Carnegie-2017]